MTDAEISDASIWNKIDHTLLKMTASWQEIKTLCDEAVKFKTASVCLPPSYVKPVSNEYNNLNICTVVGFPLGYSITAAKILETERAILSGASEIDMVINVSDIKTPTLIMCLKKLN